MTLNQSVRRDSVIQWFNLNYNIHFGNQCAFNKHFEHYLPNSFYCWNFNENIQNTRNIFCSLQTASRSSSSSLENSDRLLFANGSIKISNDLKIKPHSLNYSQKIRLFIKNKAHERCKVLPIVDESSKTFVIRLIIL